MEYPSRTMRVLYQVFQWYYVTVGSALGGQCVETVVYSDKPNAEKRKDTLDIVSRFLIISSKSR